MSVNCTTARKSVKQRDAVGFTQWTRRVYFVYRLYEHSLFHKTVSEIKITQDTYIRIMKLLFILSCVPVQTYT